jgi:hypothetical protein
MKNAVYGNSSFVMKEKCSRWNIPERSIKRIGSNSSLIVAVP